MASFDQIVHAPALAVPRHGWLNVHPSALPHYRGPEPVYWALADGAEQTGITLHRAVPTFDAGPILAQRRVDIAPDDDAGTLTRRLCAAGVTVLGKAVAGLLGDEPGEPIDLAAATYRPSVGHRNLDRAASALAAERMVRAGAPDLPAFTRHRGTVDFVRKARLLTKGCTDADLRYPDGCLRLLDTSDRCSCKAGAEPCPQLEI
jgi:methionyl-tRNA formyltransferase